MIGKNILLLCYWGIDDVLTASAALSHAQIIRDNKNIGKVVLVTIERSTSQLKPGLSVNKFMSYQLSSTQTPLNLLTKIADFISFPKKLNAIAKAEKIDAVVAVGTLAGSLALKLSKISNLPFYVSFYEPHAEYMLDTATWKRYDPRYYFQKKWEMEQGKKAAGLITVSEKFKLKLESAELVKAVSTFVSNNIVSQEIFNFKYSYRKRIREELSFTETCIVGIYAGKYGDLYYDHEAFMIYKKCFDLIPDFRLIILTPQSQERILQRLQEHNIDLNKVYLASVTHEQVPAYLSTSDFAFATIKSYPSARYCSPIKIGEYWANGLPVLLTEGIGDDSDIIKNEGGGALFNLQEEGSLDRGIGKIQQILKDPAHRQEIPKLALKYRSPDKIKEAYDYFFGNMEADK